ELHRARGGDGRGSTPTREHRDLAERVAGAKRSDHCVVLAHLRSPGDDPEHREPEVALVDELRTGIDLDVGAHGRQLLALVLRELGECRDLCECGSIHPTNVPRRSTMLGYRVVNVG